MYSLRCHRQKELIILACFLQDSLWLHCPFSDLVLLHVVTRVLSYPSHLFESRQPVSHFPAIFSSHPFPTQSEHDEHASTRAPRVSEHPELPSVPSTHSPIVSAEFYFFSSVYYIGTWHIINGHPNYYGENFEKEKTRSTTPTAVTSATVTRLCDITGYRAEDSSKMVE